MTYSKWEIADKLKAIVGDENASTATAELFVYSFDGGIHRKMPDAVVRPGTASEVQQIVRMANEHEVPLVPRGAGTGLCGGAVPIRGGVVVDMQRMNELREIRVDGIYAVVEPGVVCDHLNAALGRHGFFVPGPASSEVATLGGMVALNSSGGAALKYGATRDFVIGMTVVMPTGEIVEVGSRTHKNSGGFQLEKLFCGMEGMLGIITEVILRFYPRPEKRAGCVACFDDLEKAGQCVANIIGAGLVPSQLEIMGETPIRAVNKATGMGLRECAGMLLIEMDGHPAQVSDQIERVGKVCRESGSIDVDLSDDPRRLDELWKGRKQMIPSLSAIEESYATVMLADDMAVPIYNVPRALAAFDEIARDYDIHIPSYGHAGDGNLHTKVLMDPTNPDHWKQAEEAVARIYDAVLALGGTTTGEHGIGITKAPFFRKERGPAIEVMRSIKKALDPKNIMNPGKLMDWTEGFVHELRYPLAEVGQDKEHLREWMKEVMTCTLCGYCKGVCPAFKSLGWDTGTARGKVLMAYGVLSGEIEPDQSVADRMFQCLLCGDCERRCPSKVRTPEIVKAARAELVDAGFFHDAQMAMVQNVLGTGNIFGDEKLELQAPTTGQATVYVGCQYGARPNVTKRYFKILEKLGIEARGTGSLCCGFPLAALGFRKSLDEYRKRFLDAHRDEEMIAFCPSCTMFLTEEYGFRVKHITQVIAERLDTVDIARAAGKVTYHDPCDLGRHLKVYDAPREILEKLGYEIVEMEHNRAQSHCCGGGGGILVSDPDTSESVSKRRIEEAADTGADLLVTACATCVQTLRKASQHMEQRTITVRDLNDVLWKALK
jgi:glycolate oxidase